MTTTHSNSYTIKSVTTDEQQTVASLLQEAGISTDRFIPVEYDNGHKRPTITGWQSLPQSEASDIDGPAGIVCGYGLVVVDVDHPEKIPEEFEKLPDTLTVDTMHGGEHRYYLVVGEQPESRSPEWGDIQSAGDMVVAPGTTFSHNECDDDCPHTGEDGYGITSGESPTTLDPGNHPAIFEKDDKEESSGVSGEVTTTIEPDQENVALMESYIREFHSDSATTTRAMNFLNDLMCGHYKKHDFTADDGSADRHEAEIAYGSQLYGIALKYGDEDEETVLQVVHDYITKTSLDERWTGDGQPRKWLQLGDDYRKNALSTVRTEFDKDTWERWQRKRDEWQTWTDEYSDLTYQFVLKAVHQLAEEMNRYPNKNEIITRADEINPGDREEESYRTVLSRLQNEHGQVKMAYLGGNAYLYYPASEPDPIEAKWFKINGTEVPLQ